MFDAMRTLPGQLLFDGSNYTLLKLVYRLRLQTIALKHTHTKMKGCRADRHSSSGYVWFVCKNHSNVAFGSL